MRNPEEIERDIARYRELSASCPSCPWGCYCDGDWSPESQLETLHKELADASL